MYAQIVRPKDTDKHNRLDASGAFSLAVKNSWQINLREESWVFGPWSQEASVHHGGGYMAGGAGPSVAVETGGSWLPQQTGSQESSSKNPKLVPVSRACHQGMTYVNQLGSFMVKGSTESQNSATSRGPHTHEPVGGSRTLWVGWGQGVHFTLERVIRAYYHTHGEKMLTGTLSFTSA